MELVNAIVEAYADELTSHDNSLLDEVHQQSMQHSHAHMLSTRVQGKFLSLISRIMQPAYVLEIGTFTGYSALCLSEGLTESGELHTIELREEDAATARANFNLLKKDKQIHLHTGNALSIIPTLTQTWDLVFIDADKTSYIAYYELALERLSDRGMIIADNVLFHGQVFDDRKNKNAAAIETFNRHVAADTRTEQLLLTVRDGLMLITKAKK